MEDREFDGQRLPGREASFFTNAVFLLAPVGSFK
jgi:hypothetical protein